VVEILVQIESPLLSPESSPRSSPESRVQVLYCPDITWHLRYLTRNCLALGLEALLCNSCSLNHKGNAIAIAHATEFILWMLVKTAAPTSTIPLPTVYLSLIRFTRVLICKCCQHWYTKGASKHIHLPANPHIRKAQFFTETWFCTEAWKIKDNWNSTHVAYTNLHG